MSLRFEVEQLCSIFDISLDPRKGQHFLISDKILELEVKVANLKPSDVVLDIGAGLGFLTEKIARKASKVYAIEIDEKLIKALKWRLRNSELIKKIKIIQEDILKYTFPHDITVVISNPPYNIISQLMIKMLKELFTSPNFRTAVLVLQQDYVKKLLSKPDSKNWGRLSAAFRYFAKGKIIEFVPRKFFFPTPDVDSMLIKIWPDPKTHKVSFNVFEKTTQLLFSSSTNKTIRSILKQYIKNKPLTSWRELIQKLDAKIKLSKRVREINLEEIEEIALFLLDNGLIALD